LSLYDSFEEKNLIIETIPKLSGNTEIEIEKIFNSFNNWIIEDRDTLIPIIGSIYDIPFKESQKVKYFQLKCFQRKN
jgi:hypothetical protein